jgi:multiple sugar transport system permease protein
VEARVSEPEPRPRRPLKWPAGLGGRSEKTIAQLLIAPGQLLMAFIVLFPAGVAIYLGFTDFDPTSGYLWFDAYKGWHWFDNYWEALKSGDFTNWWIGGGFWNAAIRTAVVTVIATAVELALGFALALLLVKNFRGRGIVTVVFLLPMMVIPAVTGFIFYMLFQTQGPFNGILTFFLHDILHLTGHIAVPWLSDPNIALFSVMVADIWQWTPLMFLILLSGLASLPEDQLNAARILGAKYRHQFRYLILPMMWPIILIAVIIRAIETFKIFDSAYLMTQGGPGDATTTISVYLFRVVIKDTQRWGYGSAVALLVLILVSLAAIRAIRPIEAAQEETIEGLVGGEVRAVEVKLEDAIEAEARV